MVGRIRVEDWHAVKKLATVYGIEADKTSGRYRYILKNDTGSIRFRSFHGMSMYLIQRRNGHISADRMADELKSSAKLDF